MFRRSTVSAVRVVSVDRRSVSKNAFGSSIRNRESVRIVMSGPSRYASPVLPSPSASHWRPPDSASAIGSIGNRSSMTATTRGPSNTGEPMKAIGAPSFGGYWSKSATR